MVKRFSTAIIISTGLLAAIIVFITFYASQVGNFIIRTSSTEYELYLSSTKEFEEPVSILNLGPGIKDFNNTTLDRIDIDYIRNTDGNSSTLTYLAYTFYARNYSSVMIDYNIKLTIEGVYKNVDNAIWIMVIEEREEIAQTSIYAKWQTKGPNIGKPENCLGFETTPFMSNMTIFDYNVKNINKEEIIKYTIVVWLEGEDADCIDNIREGSIQLLLKFNAFR